MKIGKNRIAVIIGKNGETKKSIEDHLGIRIIIDSRTGDCEIKPIIEHPNYNPLNVYAAEKILNAINRGFNPIKAMKLLEETFDLEIFNLYNILGKSEKKIKTPRPPAGAFYYSDLYTHGGDSTIETILRGKGPPPQLEKHWDSCMLLHH